jgi:hypothetical protein
MRNAEKRTKRAYPIKDYATNLKPCDEYLGHEVVSIDHFQGLYFLSTLSHMKVLRTYRFTENAIVIIKRK